MVRRKEMFPSTAGISVITLSTISTMPARLRSCLRTCAIDATTILPSLGMPLSRPRPCVSSARLTRRLASCNLVRIFCVTGAPSSRRPPALPCLLLFSRMWRALGLGRLRITTQQQPSTPGARPAVRQPSSVAGRRRRWFSSSSVVVVRFSVCTTKVRYFSSRPDLVKGGRHIYWFWTQDDIE